MASFLAAGMQTATWLSAGMGEGRFFLLDWPALEPQSTSTRPHMQAETEAVAEDVRCCMLHAPRRSPPKKAPCGRPRPHIYWADWAVSRCAGRAIHGPDVRRGAGLNRHRACENVRISTGPERVCRFAGSWSTDSFTSSSCLLFFNPLHQRAGARSFAQARRLLYPLWCSPGLWSRLFLTRRITWPLLSGRQVVSS
jgi:hypothetical protein